MSSEKSLIVFDTNTIRSVIGGEPRYDSFDFGNEFNKLYNFIEDNNLREFITLAITEMTLGELLKQKKKSFKKDLTNFKLSANRLSTLENVSIQNFILPDEEFDIENYLSPKVEFFLEEKKIRIIKLKHRDKARILGTLVEKVLETESPFRENGQGFKDAIIMETLLHDTHLSRYNNFILVTKDREFDNCIKRVPMSNVECVISIEYLVEKLERLYSCKILEDKYNSIISDNYFKKQIKQEIKCEFDCRLKDIVIKKNPAKIIDKKEELWKQFQSDNENEDYFEGMFGCFYLFSIGNNQYQMKILYDLNASQIEKINIEESRNG